MAAKAGRLQVQLDMQVAQLQRDLDKANKMIEWSTKSWAASFKRSAESFVGNFASSAVTTAISGINQLLSDTLSRFDDIADGAKRVGLSAEHFQELSYAAEQSGLEMADLEKALFRMQRQFATLGTEGGAKFEKFISDIGLKVEDLQSMGDKDRFIAIVDALGKVPDATARAALGYQAFGKQAQALGPLMAEGKQGIEGMIEAAHRLGIIMSNDAVKAGEAFNDQMDTLKLSLMGVISQGLEPLLPQLTAIAGEFLTTGKNAQGASAKIDLFGIAANAVAEDLIETIRIVRTLSQNMTTLRELAAVPASLSQIMSGQTAAGIARVWDKEAARVKQINEDAQNMKDAVLRSRIHLVKAWEDSGAAAKGAAEDTEDATNRTNQNATATGNATRVVRQHTAAVKDDNSARQQQLQLERDFENIRSKSDASADRVTDLINERTIAIKRNQGASEDELEIERMRQQGASETEIALRQETQAWDRATAASAARQQQIADDARAKQDIIIHGFENIFFSMTEGADAAKQAVAQLVIELVSLWATQKLLQATGFNANGSWGWQGVAKGAAFDPRGMVPFAQGGVVMGPTPFRFGGSQLGVMGEAGPEAVMPLARDASGRLGVRAAGGAGGVSVAVHNYAGAQIGVEQRGQEIAIIVDQVRGTLASDISRGGNVLSGALEGAYRLRR